MTAQELEHLDTETIDMCILKLITVGFWINISQYFIGIYFVFKLATANLSSCQIFYMYISDCD